MGDLTPGRGVWFSERQRDKSSKDVPGIVLWVGENRPVLVIVRGTSQGNDRFCSSEDAVILAPADPCGARLELTSLTYFRADDVKVIATESVVKHCGRMTRDVWRRITSLTQPALQREVAELSLSAE